MTQNIGKIKLGIAHVVDFIFILVRIPFALIDLLGWLMVHGGFQVAWAMGHVFRAINRFQMFLGKTLFPNNP